MTQSPLSPTLPPISEFVQHYINSLENLPLDMQRHVTCLREYDILYRNVMQQVGQYLLLYRKADSGPCRKKYLTKIQKCLIESQQYGDDKLNIISQIVEMIEVRTQQLNMDAQRLDMENIEEDNRTSSHEMITCQTKMEKGVKITDKPQRNVCEKPRRQPRRTRVTEKVSEKIEKGDSAVQCYMDGEELEEEEIDEEQLQGDEEVEIKVKRELKRKQEKPKEKEKAKEGKDERKEERRSAGKVTKKTTPKQVTTKIKKKRKKEKESTIEDIHMDPDEPTYCICDSISYGDMIGCDNDECEIEWFHFGCVKLTHKPKGKWYCPRCSAERKEKGKK